MTYTVDQLGAATRVGLLLRIASDPVVRMWWGQVRDLPIPVGGAEIDSGAIYKSMGLLGSIPSLGGPLNGDAERGDFSISAVGLPASLVSMAQGSAALIRGKAIDVGVVLFDEDWQPIPPVFWTWSGTVDQMSILRVGDPERPTRAIKVSAGNVFTGRHSPNLGFFTDIDQRRRSADDAFCSEVARLQDGTTKAWGQA